LQINVFDTSLIALVNSLSQRSVVFDQVVAELAENHMFKGVAMCTLWWWVWFSTEGREDDQPRRHLLATVIGAFVSVFVARVMAKTLPFRVRPLHNDSLDFLPPFGVPPRMLDGWSSFPSDHAALFFALAAGLWFVSRRTGVLAIVYVTVCIALPRVYEGFHYPTDLLVGGLVGVAAAVATNASMAQTRWMGRAVRWSRQRPAPFYAALFLVTAQMSVLFESSRNLLSDVVRGLRALVG